MFVILTYFVSKVGHIGGGLEQQGKRQVMNKHNWQERSNTQ